MLAHWNDFTKNVSNIRMPHGSLISTLDTHSAGAFLLFALTHTIAWDQAEKCRIQPMAISE